MNIKTTLVRAAGVVTAAIGVVGLSLPAAASAPAPASPTAPGAVAQRAPSTALTDPNTCSFRTTRGFYLTAVGGGGRTTDVIHTDATRVGSWEKFTLVYSGDGVHYGLRTTNGHYVTAVNSGGLTTAVTPDVLHTDATQLLSWEKFSFALQPDGTWGVRAFDGHYLTAISAGGRTFAAINSDATAVNSWEKFRITCNI